MRRTLVLADLHLAHEGTLAAGDDLARLVRRHGGDEIVLAGDSFDLSVDPPSRDPLESLLALLRPQRELRDALHAHLSAGHPVALLGGNHDAALSSDMTRAALLQWLALDSSAPLSLPPWFVRRGPVHIEHGHVFDPDNAPAHPLSSWSPATEPLGIALTRRFLAPSGALAFAHAHETTPLAGFLRTFRLYGARAPVVVARYFATAISLCLEAGKQPGLSEERTSGESRLPEFADSHGLCVDALSELTRAVPKPRHHEPKETFERLYFDRIGAAVLTTAAGIVALGGSAPAAAMAVAGAAFLGYSVSKGVSRYSGEPERRLRDGAELVRSLTGARHVVLGHTHREDEAPGYFNTGSFAFSRAMGRPHLLVDADGNIERRVFPAAV